MKRPFAYFFRALRDGDARKAFAVNKEFRFHPFHAAGDGDVAQPHAVLERAAPDFLHAAGNEDAAGDGETAADGEGAGSEENSDGIETGDGGASYDDGNSDTGDGIVVVGDGSSGDGYSENGDSGDGSYSDGSYEQPIEIQDAGNGSYFYDGGSGDGGSSDGGSYSDDGSAWTPSDVIIQGISSRYIGEEELYNYDAGQLRLIRNEIFALNGRIFESQDLRDYFSQKSWYVPTYDPEEFDANMFYYLNDYEEANLNVILNYEAALGGY